MFGLLYKRNRAVNTLLPLLSTSKHIINIPSTSRATMQTNYEKQDIQVRLLLSNPNPNPYRSGLADPNPNPLLV